jgi:hypothetical protein
VLAAIRKAESNHGENMGASNAGAMGPMQFLLLSWKNTGLMATGAASHTSRIPKMPYGPLPCTSRPRVCPGLVQSPVYL